MESIKTPTTADTFLLSRGVDPKQSEDELVLGLLVYAGANDLSDIGNSHGPLEKRQVLPALTFLLRQRLAHCVSLSGDRTTFGWLIGWKMTPPSDWHQVVRIFDEAAYDLRLIVRSAPQDQYSILHERLRASRWISSPTASTARSLLGMMKPELGVSDFQRRSIFAQWVLGLPLEAIESSSLKDLYLDDHQPGAARFRINNGDEGSSGEFLNWLTEFNGAPLKRGASRLVIPLNTQVFIQGATRAANP
ncbi:hypothetical protein N9R32_00150 [Actinomycetota bacterium]|jgi:hypothetical protein|nr:hypothetical protein [Actinomycetota bacterium]